MNTVVACLDAGVCEVRKGNSRRLNKDELNISNWKYPDEGALPDGPMPVRGRSARV